MGYVIALAGKGGTGKTTVAALLVRLIKENKLGSVLAIDADPNSNLAESLGTESKEDIGKLLDDIAAHPEGVPAGMTKDRFIEYRVQGLINEEPGFDVLTMGKPEGPGCYCYVNNVLRNIMAGLIKDYDYVVIDNEAGLEHLSRRTTRSADILLIVSDSTKAGLTCARRIRELADELKISVSRKALVINRADTGKNNASTMGPGIEYLGSIPFDAEIEKLGRNGGSLMTLNEQAISINTLRELGEKIWQSN
ncbi:MAG: AAA family ATPase [Candidatus Omnitrophota bacterium]